MTARFEQIKQKTFPLLSEQDDNVMVDLWEIDLRKLGGKQHYFCAIANEKGGEVVWQGKAYGRLPIAGEGFELSSQGAPKRPKLSVPNIAGFVTAATEEYSQMVGATVVRRQVMKQFLDAVNFKAGNPEADSLQEIKSKYVVERMTSLTPEFGIFELAYPSESVGSTFPCRMMLADLCCWEYRSEECSYAGRPVADEYDMPTDDINKDKCSKRILGCKARFGETAVLPFGGWPGADKVRT